MADAKPSMTQAAFVSQQVVDALNDVADRLHMPRVSVAMIALDALTIGLARTDYKSVRDMLLILSERCDPDLSAEKFTATAHALRPMAAALTTAVSADPEEDQ